MIKRSRILTPADVALVREALVAAGLEPALADGTTTGRDLWQRRYQLAEETGQRFGQVLKRLRLPVPPRQPGDTVHVTVTVPADLNDAYERAGHPGGGRAALLQQAMRRALEERGHEVPPEPPAPPARVLAAARARTERRERSRR